jgi:voltage-gated potassium channel
VERGHENTGRRPAPPETYGPRVTLRRVWAAFSALGIITAVGVLGYVVFEGWTFGEALYMTVITLTTVGYREVRELDMTGQLWTMALLITGVGTLFYAAVSSVELAVEGAVQGYFGRRRMRASIDRLSGHHVLCGFGRVGHQVAREFTHDGVPFVVIDNDPQKIEECSSEGYLALFGDASDDAVLEEAGVQMARGLVAALSSDAANVFVTLSARKMNPGLHIVARSSSDESAAKLEMAGADRTLSPYAVGGRRLASLATHTPDRGLPRHRHPRREGHRVPARRVCRAKGVPASQPYHRRAQDRGENRRDGLGYPQLTGTV